MLGLGSVQTALSSITGQCRLTMYASIQGFKKVFAVHFLVDDLQAITLPQKHNALSSVRGASLEAKTHVNTLCSMKTITYFK